MSLPLRSPEEDSRNELLYLESENRKLKQKMAKKTEYIELQSLDDKQVVRNAILGATDAYNILEKTVEEGDSYKRTRYIALAEALKARETAGSERKKMECAEKKATDAEHSIREAENEVEMRKERALAGKKFLEDTLADDNATEEEKLVAQLWSDAREKGLAAAVKKVQPAKELFQNLKAEADNAIVKARIADEQDKTKRAAAEAQMVLKDRKKYRQITEGERVFIEELMVAARCGRAKDLQNLLYYGADVNAEGSDGQTALLEAVENEHLHILQVLLARRANVNVVTKDVSTGLILAAVKGCLEMVEVLLDNGANVNAPDNCLRTALIYASSNGYLHIVPMLLKKGANIDAADCEGETALMAAASWGYSSVAQELIKKGACLNIKNIQGKSALAIAEKSGQKRSARILKAAGAQR